MSSICVIPAKGMSKRLPGKNIKEFAGRPIIEYTIEAAIGADCFDEIIVSTRDGEIREIAEKAGAVPFFRSPETITDDAPMVDCVIEVLEVYPAEVVCMAYAAAPFIKASKIWEAELATYNGYDTIFTGYRAEPPERVMIKHGDHFISRYPEYDNTNSQHFPAAYHSAGQFYFCKAEMVRRLRTVMLPRCWIIEIPQWEAVDIDTPEDWERAEILYEMRGK